MYCYTLHYCVHYCWTSEPAATSWTLFRPLLSLCFLVMSPPPPPPLCVCFFSVSPACAWPMYISCHLCIPSTGCGRRGRAKGRSSPLSMYGPGHGGGRAGAGSGGREGGNFEGRRDDRWVCPSANYRTHQTHCRYTYILWMDGTYGVDTYTPVVELNQA